MNTRLISLLTTVLIGLTFFSQLNAQTKATAKIYGQVVDAETGESLIGANVRITDTMTGTATDIDGRYSLEGLEAGTYSLTVSYISYQTKMISDIILSDGQALKLDIPLSIEQLNLGEEIVVTATAVKSSEGALLRVRQKAVSFSDAISAEGISNSGVSDAAGVMKKVVGASVVGGKYVYVRGLGERYSTTHMNGIELPTSDPDKKSFQLDMIPASLIENIVTLKTFTPDKPGNFSGGLVDVSTKDFPEKLIFNASVSTSYNSQASFETGILGKRSGTDWLGYDDGQRDMPSIAKNLSAEDIPSEIQARKLDSPEAALLNDFSRAFNTEMTPTETNLPLNHGGSFTVGNQIGTKIGKVGYSASLTYSRSFSNYSDGEVGRYLLVGEYGGTDDLTATRLFDDRNSSDNVDIGGLFTLAYIPHTNHKFNATLFKTQSGQNQARFISGFWIDIPTDSQYQTRVLSYTQRSLNAYFFKGKDYFENLNGLQLDWDISFADNQMDTPDLRYFSSMSTQTTIAGKDTVLYDNPKSLFPRPSRFFRDLSETSSSYKADLSMPFQMPWNKQQSKIKAGVLYEAKDRDFNERRFDYDDKDSDYTFRASGGDPSIYFAGTGIVDTTSRRYDFGVFVQDGSETKNSYSAESEVFAYYGMLDMFVTDGIRFIGGARVESTDIRAISDDTSQVRGELDNIDVLPSANMVFTLMDDVNLRVAYSKTLARPTFRELMPFVSFDFVGDFLFQGKPDLERTKITNYDARLEWFTGPGEILAVSGFYKDIQNPMERVIRNDLGNNATSIQNVDQGRVLGLEIEFRKNLGFITDALSNFSIASNYTRVHSSVDIGEIELGEIRAANPDASSTRQLFGQSPYIVNVDLAYDNLPKGIVANLSFNRFGDRLSVASGNATPNIFERAYNTLNFNVNKKFKNGFSLGLKATNLLNPDIVQSYKFKGEEYIFSSYQKGVNIGVSLKYSL